MAAAAFRKYRFGAGDPIQEVFIFSKRRGKTGVNAFLRCFPSSYQPRQQVPAAGRRRRHNPSCIGHLNCGAKPLILAGPSAAS